MADFRFRYQRLLDLKGQQEKMQAQVVAAKRGEVMRQRHALTRIENKWQECRRHWIRLATEGGAAHDLSQGASRLEYLRIRLESQKRSLERSLNELRSERAKLLDLVKQRKVLEALRDRALDAYREKQKRLDQILLDEVASVREWRKSRVSEKRPTTGY